MRMISVVVTNFNSAHLLSKNLPKIFSLLNRSKLDYEVIVVDDCSTDNSRDVLGGFKIQDLRFKTIYKDKNEGFGSTADQGIRAAKAEIVFTLKTDTVPERADYFKLMLEHFEKSPDRNASSVADAGGVFAVSAALQTVEQGTKEIRGQGQIYFDKGFFLHRRAPQLTNSLINQSLLSSWPDGSASAFNKEIYLKLGGFDSLYDPFYWEDVDLGYRAWKAGYQIHFEPEAVLLHDYLEGPIVKTYSPEFRRQISLRNQLIFLWKNGDLSSLVKHCLWWPYHALVAIKNGDVDFFKAQLLALGKFIDILKGRRILGQLSKLSDKEVLLKLGVAKKGDYRV